MNKIDETTYAKKFAMPVGIVVAIQKIGKAKIEEIKEKLIEWKICTSRTTFNRIRNETEKLCSKGLLAKSYETDDDNNTTDAYKLAVSKWKNIPPTAHFKDIVDNPDAKLLIDTLDSSKGATKRSKFTGDYKYFKVVLSVRDFVFGFYPTNAQDPRKYNHYRGKWFGLNGALKNTIVMQPSHFRAWIRSNFNSTRRSEFEISKYDIDLITTNWGKVDLNGSKTTYITKSVLSGESFGKQASGKGLNDYECIPNGSTIETYFSFPGKYKDKVIDLSVVQRFFHDICYAGGRGFGGRGIDGGKLSIAEINPLTEEEYCKSLIV